MTTFKGRVVYERKVHMFSGKDIARIQKKVFADADFNESSTIIADSISSYLIDHKATVLTAVYLWVVTAKVFLKYLGMDVKTMRETVDELRNEISFGLTPEPEDYIV